MSVRPELIVDLREEFELLEKKLVPTTNKYEVVNIPSRHIFANVDWITKQSHLRPLWLLCASGRRSQAIKDQYFPKNDGIKSSWGGLKFDNGDEHPRVDPNELKIEYGAGGFGLQQYMQIAFAGMLSLVVIMLYLNLDRIIVLSVVSGMIIMVLGQTFTKSCLLGKIIPKSQFIPVS